MVQSVPDSGISKNIVVDVDSFCPYAGLICIAVSRGFNGHEQFDLAFQQFTDLGSFLLSKLLMLFQHAAQEECAG